MAGCGEKLDTRQYEQPVTSLCMCAARSREVQERHPPHPRIVSIQYLHGLEKADDPRDFILRRKSASEGFILLAPSGPNGEYRNASLLDAALSTTPEHASKFNIGLFDVSRKPSNRHRRAYVYVQCSTLLRTGQGRVPIVGRGRLNSPR